MKNIKVRDEEYLMLKKLSQLLRTQNNKATENPLFVVQIKKYRIATCEEVENKNVEYFDIYDEDLADTMFGQTSMTDLFIEFKSTLKERISDYEKNNIDDNEEDNKYLERYKFILDAIGYATSFFICNLDGILKNTEFSLCYYNTYYEDDNYFLTSQEAENYIKYQNHNLNKPRIYIKSVGRRNGGYLPRILKFLKNLKFVEKGV